MNLSASIANSLSKYLLIPIMVTFFLGVSHLNTFVCYLLSFGGAFLDFLQAVNVYIYANEFSVV